VVRLPISLGILAVVLAVFLGALDQTVIVTVLPAVVVDLAIPFDQIDRAAWVVSGYLLGYAVALPLMGRLADRRGRRLALSLSLGLFALGSLGCALSPSLLALILSRLVQAAGGGALLPVAIAIVGERYAPDRRLLIIGVIGAVAEAGGVVGPLYGAAIVSVLSWRWIFVLNLPLSIVLLVLAVRDLPRRADPGGPIDFGGAVVLALSLGSFVVGCSHETLAIAGRDVRPILIVLAVGLLAVFFAVELRAQDPIVNLPLLREPAFAAAILGGFVLGGSLIVAMVDVPLYAATILNATPAGGGLLLMRLTALIPIGALLGGLLGQRLGLAVPTGLGFLLSAVGLSQLASLGATPLPAPLWWSLGLTGLGFGVLIAPLTMSSIVAAGDAYAASAASLFTVARLLGMTVGLSVLTAWGLRRFNDLAGVIPLPLPQIGESAAQFQTRIAVYNHALLGVGAEVYHEIFLGAAALSLVGLVAVPLLRAVRPGHPLSSTADSD